MGVMPCDVCDMPLSKIIIYFGSRYIRLCDNCYEEIKDKKIEELRDKEGY